MPAYSHSRLGTFETCPFQYKLRYLDKIVSPEEGIEAFLGSRFHEVMQKLYGDLAVKTHSLDELQATYDSRWEHEFHGEVKIARKDRTAEDYRILGRTFIRDYYARYAPFRQSRVLGLERQIMIDLDGTGRYKIMGYIDRLALAPDGTYEIHDYKTSGSFPEQRELDEDRQLALYQLGVQTGWPDADRVELIWHYVAFDKEMTSQRTPAELTALKNDVVTLIEEIESTPRDGFEPQESRLCDWCGYWNFCPVKRHLVKVDSLPAPDYLAEDGVKIVNAFAALVEKKRGFEAEIEAVDEELDKVKAAALAYGAQEGMKVLKGSGHLLRMSERTQVSSPAKGSEERTALENILKDAGVWDDASALDPYALARAVNEGAWDAAVLARVRAFLKVEKRPAFALSGLGPGDDER